MLDLNPTPADLQSANGDDHCRAGGHLDESTAFLAGEEITADVLAEIETDRAIQTADEAAIGELQATFAAAKEAIGTARVRLTRSVVVSDETRERTAGTEYTGEEKGSGE